jgi:nucleotide-binding universal stress UspA family protein
VRRIYPPSEVARELAVPAARARDGFRVLTCIANDSAGPALVAMARALGGDDADVIALHLANDDTDAGAVLAPALSRASELGVSARPLAFASGDPADDIVRIADARDVDVVLLGTYGGVAAAVFARAPATIAAVDLAAALADPPTHVLVPVDGSSDGDAALAVASRMQRASGIEITVVDVAATRAARRSIERCEQSGGKLVVESAPTVTAARAAAFDLVVVGASQRALLPPDTRSLVVRGPREAR